MSSLLLAAAAFATEPVADEEITIYGDPLVEQTRDALVSDIVGLGYGDRVRHRDGRTVYFHEDHWRGKVVLTDDGRVSAKRTGPRLTFESPSQALLCVTQPSLCIKTGAWIVADRKWGNLEDTLSRSTAVSQVAFGDRVADASVRRTVDALPDRLTALWEHGTPLVPGAPILATMDERKAAILAYYRSRTDTVWGDQVRDAVAAFVRAVVMTSDDPFEPEEMAAMGDER
jgi:hypothetical protein